ncbi:MAG TPA: transposase, partial [Polyangiaceae bacterium]|nr:transposase [Polyangiaceae bacterium]
MEKMREELKSELSELGPRGRGRPYPKGLLEKLLSYTVARRTDATGVAIRPEPLPDGRRQACRKGHFFVVLADKKHVFVEFQPKHTSAAVCEMFRGFSGYIQADAHAIYDALFRGDAVEDGADPP